MKTLVTRSSMPPFEEYTEMIKPLWESVWLTNNGDLHKEFEKELKNYLKVQGLSLMTNGHMSLELAIQALGIAGQEEGGEVITTPFTFASTTHAIVRNRLKPVFCDIRRDNYTIDTSRIEALITGKTKAILAVHVYGSPCDVYAIDEIAEKYNLKVIYDAAHAFGVRIRRGEEELGIARFGDASILSFHATKVFHTIEGGAVAFPAPRTGDILYRLKNFGIMSETEVDYVGANAKLDEFRAAMGLCNLKYIDREIEKRKTKAERYRMNLQDTEGIALLPEQEGVVSNYAYFPVLIEDEFPKTRDQIYTELREKDIFARRYFYPLTSRYSCYEGKFDAFRTPVAEEIAEKILCLPLFADLPDETIDTICGLMTARRFQ